MGGKLLRLRWSTTCVDCGRALAPGEQAWWFHVDDAGRCLPCAEPSPATDPVTTPSGSPPSATPSASVGKRRAAGASAQAEYDRRRSKDRARGRRALPRLLPLVIVAPLVGYFGVQVGADLLDGKLRTIASSAVEGGVDTDPMFDSGLVHLIGLLVALAMTLSVAMLVFGSRRSTEAWRIGAEGERLTGRVLRKLPPSYRVLHDLPMPRSKANIDHVVVGPTGVFTVETKNYKSGIQIKRGRAYGAGRRLDHVVQQAKRQATTVAASTGSDVTPIVCVHGGGVRVEGWLQKPIVDGVRFCSGRRLTKVIAGNPARLDDESIRTIERQLAGHDRASSV